MSSNYLRFECVYTFFFKLQSVNDFSPIVTRTLVLFWENEIKLFDEDNQFKKFN